jgi:hypothetical protein
MEDRALSAGTPGDFRQPIVDIAVAQRETSRRFLARSILIDYDHRAVKSKT